MGGYEAQTTLNVLWTFFERKKNIKVSKIVGIDSTLISEKLELDQTLTIQQSPPDSS